MKSLRIKISSINDICDMVMMARTIDGDIYIKNRYCIKLNAKDPVEIFSTDLSRGVDIYFPKKEKEFEDFLQKFIWAD